jgi:hypothetical protein
MEMSLLVRPTHLIRQSTHVPPPNTAEHRVSLQPTHSHDHLPCSPGQEWQGKVDWTSKDNMVKDNWSFLFLSQTFFLHINMSLLTKKFR